MSRDEVRTFLLDFKRAVSESSGVYLIPREGNLLTMRYLGLTKRNVEEILIGLTVLDYCVGPKPDRDNPGEIWEFGKVIEGEDVYIKLKVAEVNSRTLAKCISFHIAKYPLKFPYQE